MYAPNFNPRLIGREPEEFDELTEEEIEERADILDRKADEAWDSRND